MMKLDRTRLRAIDARASAFLTIFVQIMTLIKSVRICPQVHLNFAVSLWLSEPQYLLGITG